MPETFETFILNDEIDANGFSMTWDAIKAGAKKWIGKPGILYEKCDFENQCKFEHTEGRNLQEAQQLSSDHKVTTIVDVRIEEATHTLFGKHQITSSEFKEQVCNEIVEFVSQSIWLDSPPLDPNKVHVNNTDYTPVHVGFITETSF